MSSPWAGSRGAMVGRSRSGWGSSDDVDVDEVPDVPEVAGGRPGASASSKRDSKSRLSLESREGRGKFARSLKLGSRVSRAKWG